MKRILEPELMDTPEAATEYNAMDHTAVNQLFAQEFLAFANETYANDLDSVTWAVLDVGTATALQRCSAPRKSRKRICDDEVSETGSRNSRIQMSTRPETYLSKRQRRH